MLQLIIDKSFTLGVQVKPFAFIEQYMIKLMSLDTVKSFGVRYDPTKTALAPGMG